MYNKYKKNRTDDIAGQQKFEYGADFYIPIGAILVNLDCCIEKHNNEMVLSVNKKDVC